MARLDFLAFFQVPLDERFIFRFFREKKSRVSDEQDSDAESVNSEDAMEAIEMFADSGTRDLDFAAAIEPDQKSGWAWVLFFAQSMHFKLALTQAAWIRFF